MGKDNGKAPKGHVPDYEVGYKKPPKDRQFEKGRSGNPKGRPKGAKGLKTVLKREIYERQTIMISGEKVTDHRLDLMIRTQAIRAAAGDGKSVDRLVPLVIQLLGVEDEGQKAALSANDQQIFTTFLEMVGMNLDMDDELPTDDQSDDVGNEADSREVVSGTSADEETQKGGYDDSDPQN